jgi:hypothetical protein
MPRKARLFRAARASRVLVAPKAFASLKLLRHGNVNEAAGRIVDEGGVAVSITAKVTAGLSRMLTKDIVTTDRNRGVLESVLPVGHSQSSGLASVQPPGGHSRGRSPGRLWSSWLRAVLRLAGRT